MSDQRIEPRPPDRIEFFAEGVLSVSEGVMRAFEGTTLKPAEVEMAIDESRTVTVDLTGTPSLRLESLDVGVNTPEVDDVISGVDPTTDDRPGDHKPQPGAIAFTVEGSILNVPEDTLEPLASGSPRVASITLTVDEAPRTDGGSDDEVLVELTLLGYGIVIYADGLIEIGTR